MRAIDISGKKFHRLTAIEVAGSKKGEGVLWLCNCDCGNQTTVTLKSLKNGNTKSCGCLSSEVIILRNKASAKHGMTSSSTWVSWMLMGQRCRNSNHKSYKNYGGRGIKICERWETFENFLADMGERPENMTLERLNSNGDYEPGNCKWATMKEQGNNRRSNFNITYQGKTQTISQWAEEIGISSKALRFRLNSENWTLKEAMTIGLNKGNRWRNRKKGILI